MTFPSIAANGLAESLHLIENLVDIWDNIFSIDVNSCIAWSAESGVEDSSVFSDIDGFSGEHPFDRIAEVGLVSEVEEKSEHGIIDTMFGVIQVDSFRMLDETFTACRVLSEEFAQV
jgi:hypothetical protein